MLVNADLAKVDPGEGDFTVGAFIFLSRTEFNPTGLRPPPPRPSNPRAVDQNQMFGTAGAEAKTDF